MEGRGRELGDEIEGEDEKDGERPNDESIEALDLLLEGVGGDEGKEDDSCLEVETLSFRRVGGEGAGETMPPGKRGVTEELERLTLVVKNE